MTVGEISFTKDEEEVDPKVEEEAGRSSSSSSSEGLLGCLPMVKISRSDSESES
jgi:hypothetical protein